MQGTFMIYGGNGYTGRLLARHAIATGRRPILCGRTPDSVQSVTRELGLEGRVAVLEDREAMARALKGVQVVLNAAGPFSATARPMLEACLASRVHYVDVSGEIDVFEALHERDGEARQRGVLVLPGAGFLVVATDCLAAEVARRLPNALTLRIATSRPAFLARGSLRTMIGLIDDHVKVRRDGLVARVAVGAIERRFDFGRGEVVCTAMSGAEVIARFFTTRIPNIQVFFPAKSHERVLYRLGAAFSGVLKTAPAQMLMRAVADELGNTQESNLASDQVVVVVAEDASGVRAGCRLVTPDAYAATAVMALAVVERVLKHPSESGFQTPGALFGAELLRSLPGVSYETLNTRSL